MKSKREKALIDKIHSVLPEGSVIVMFEECDPIKLGAVIKKTHYRLKVEYILDGKSYRTNISAHLNKRYE